MPDYRGISPEVDDGADLGSTTQRWRKLYANVIDPGAHVNGAFNKKETFTSSGAFVAPVTGVYRITLQGGGGGGGAGGTREGSHFTGGGGGSGAKLVFYEKLISGTSYSYTIGAGGAGKTNATPTTTAGNWGDNGGASSTTINGNEYVAGGGGAGGGSVGSGALAGGHSGEGKINGTTVTRGFAGGSGSIANDVIIFFGGFGGGEGGNRSTASSVSGAGGAGGAYGNSDGATYINGMAGGNGYITFEYYDPTA